MNEPEDQLDRDHAQHQLSLGLVEVKPVEIELERWQRYAKMLETVVPVGTRELFKRTCFKK